MVWGPAVKHRLIALHRVPEEVTDSHQCHQLMMTLEADMQELLKACEGDVQQLAIDFGMDVQ